MHADQPMNGSISGLGFSINTSFGETTPILQVSTTSRQPNGENRQLREPCILLGDFRGHADLIGHLLSGTSVDSER